MMLAKLIKVDRQHRPRGTVAGVIGDGYLLKKNLVYRNLRRAALNYGYSFVEAWPEYSAMGLSQLEKIIALRKIPMNFTGQLLREIENRSQASFELRDLPGPVSSYHMHETAHCLADVVLKSVVARTNRERLLKAMVSESFANACDSLASGLADSEDHSMFIKLNSYMGDSTRTRKLKGRVREFLGFRNYFFLVFYSYLYANFLYEKLSPEFTAEVLARIVPGRRFSKKQISDCHRCMEIGLDLNIEFRTRTNLFYLRSNGMGADLLKALDFDFHGFILKHKEWNLAIEEMADLIEFGELTGHA